MHFLPKDAKGFDLVNQFDVPAVASLLLRKAAYGSTVIALSSVVKTP